MVDRGTLMSTKKQNGIVSNDCFYEVFSMGMGILLFQTSSNKICPQACRINLFSFFWRTSCHRHSHLKAQPKWLYYPHAHDVTCYRSPVRYIAHRRNNDPLYDFILKNIQWSLDCGQSQLALKSKTDTLVPHWHYYGKPCSTIHTMNTFWPCKVSTHWYGFSWSITSFLNMP